MGAIAAVVAMLAMLAMLLRVMLAQLAAMLLQWLLPQRLRLRALILLKVQQ